MSMKGPYQICKFYLNILSKRIKIKIGVLYTVLSSFTVHDVYLLISLLFGTRLILGSNILSCSAYIYIYLNYQKLLHRRCDLLQIIAFKVLTAHIEVS